MRLSSPSTPPRTLRATKNGRRDLHAAAPVKDSSRWRTRKCQARPIAWMPSAPHDAIGRADPQRPGGWMRLIAALVIMSRVAVVLNSLHDDCR